MYDSRFMDQQLDEPDLRSYLGVIARRRWFVIVTTLIFVGAAAVISLVPEPEYRVRAQVLTTGVNDPVAMIFGANDTGDLDRQAVSQDAFLTSSRMRLEVASAYDGPMEEQIFRVSASPMGSKDQNRTSSVVELSLVSSDPRAAASLINTYAATYVELRQAMDVERLANVKRQLQALLEETEAQIAQVSQPLAEIDEQIRATPADADVLFDQRDVVREELRNELDPLESEASRIRTTLGDINLGVELSAGGGAEVLSTAWVPDAPVSPNIPLNIAIGLVIGLFVGSLLAFVRDYFDDSVKSKEVVDKVTGVSTLGLIPKVERRRAGHGDESDGPRGRGVPLAAHVGEVPRDRTPGAGRAGDQSVAGRGQDDGGGEPGGRLRPVGRPGGARRRRSAPPAAWKTCSTCRSRRASPRCSSATSRCRRRSRPRRGSPTCPCCPPASRRPTRPSC